MGKYYTIGENGEKVLVDTGLYSILQEEQDEYVDKEMEKGISHSDIISHDTNCKEFDRKINEAIQKSNINLIKDYGNWEQHPTKDAPNIWCGECGGDVFKICWVNYPYTGGFFKWTCSHCGNSEVMLDSFS